MQMFSKQVKPSKSHGGEGHGTTSPQPKPIRQGRERLVNFCAQIEAAEHVIGELTEHVARLKAVVVEAQESHRALQECIAADGGVELAKFSSGQCKEDDPISQLVKRERTSSAASAAAAAGIPHAEALLSTALQQLTTLTNEKHDEVGRVIAHLAGKQVAEYERSFEATCLLLDSLIGFSRVGESNVGDVYRIHEQAKLPRIVANGDSTSDPFIRHHTNEHIVSDSAARWTEIRSRLEANANCDLADLEIRKQQ
jgi:hypothetical protein